METLIRFDDIIAVQKSLLEVNAMRVSYQEPKSEMDWPQLTLHIKKKEIDIHKFEKIEADIVGKIIQKMYECSTKSIQQDYDSITSKVVYSSNQIAIKTGRGPGNFAIFSEEWAKKFEKEPYSGSVSQTIKMYVSPHLKSGILVGYKGKGKFDTGLIMFSRGKDFQIVDIGSCERYYIYIGDKNEL